MPRGVGLVLRYCLTWDGSGSMDAMLLEFGRSLCTAEQHLPRAMGEPHEYLLLVNNVSHGTVARWLASWHATVDVALAWPAKSRIRLVNLDRSHAVERDFSAFVAWHAANMPANTSAADFRLKADDYASVRRLFADVHLLSPEQAHLLLGADTVFVRAPAQLAARVRSDPSTAQYMIDNQGRRGASHPGGARTKSVWSWRPKAALLAAIGHRDLAAAPRPPRLNTTAAWQCEGLLGDFVYLPAGVAIGADAISTAQMAARLLRAYASQCRDGVLAGDKWMGAQAVGSEKLHGIDQYVWGVLLWLLTDGRCQMLDDGRYDTSMHKEPLAERVEVAHSHSKSKIMRALPMLTSADERCWARGTWPPGGSSATQYTQTSQRAALRSR